MKLLEVEGGTCPSVPLLAAPLCTQAYIMSCNPILSVIIRDHALHPNTRITLLQNFILHCHCDDINRPIN